MRLASLSSTRTAVGDDACMPYKRRTEEHEANASQETDHHILLYARSSDRVKQRISMHVKQTERETEREAYLY